MTQPGVDRVVATLARSRPARGSAGPAWRPCSCRPERIVEVVRDARRREHVAERLDRLRARPTTTCRGAFDRPRRDAGVRHVTRGARCRRRRASGRRSVALAERDVDVRASLAVAPQRRRAPSRPPWRDRWPADHGADLVPRGRSACRRSRRSCRPLCRPAAAAPPVTSASFVVAPFVAVGRRRRTSTTNIKHDRDEEVHGRTGGRDERPSSATPSSGRRAARPRARPLRGCVIPMMLQ